MSDKSPKVIVRMPVKLLALLDLEIEDCNASRSHLKHTRSSWIRMAVAMQLEIARQRRKVKGPKKFKCSLCGRKITEGEIGTTTHLLYGPTAYICNKCSPSKTSK